MLLCMQLLHTNNVLKWWNSVEIFMDCMVHSLISCIVCTVVISCIHWVIKHTCNKKQKHLTDSSIIVQVEYSNEYSAGVYIVQVEYPSESACMVYCSLYQLMNTLIKLMLR